MRRRAGTRKSSRSSSRKRSTCRYGLAPSLLAQLPAIEAITLNYDSLFKNAASDSGSARRVSPSKRLLHTQQWLLKLHGSADLEDTIVLMRENYLGYDTDRSALGALVKATLMTRHLLFVGFGLADDHFHDILFRERRALRAQDPKARLKDSVLYLGAKDPLDDVIWDDDLKIKPSGAWRLS